MKGLSMRRMRYLNTILTVLAVLLTLNLYATWSVSPVSIASEAQAQGISNAGSQRKEMVDLLKQINVRLSDMNKSLSDGSVRVRVEGVESQ